MLNGDQYCHVPRRLSLLSAMLLTVRVPCIGLIRESAHTLRAPTTLCFHVSRKCPSRDDSSALQQLHDGNDIEVISFAIPQEARFWHHVAIQTLLPPILVASFSGDTRPIQH